MNKKYFILIILFFTILSCAIFKPIDVVTTKIIKTNKQKYLDKENVYYQYLIKSKEMYSIEVNCFINNEIALGAFNRQLHVITKINLITDKRFPVHSGVNKLSGGNLYIILVKNCLIKEFLKNTTDHSLNKIINEFFDNELMYLKSIS